MGQRANLVLIEEGTERLFYSHWRANCLDRDLFWGPEHSRAFVTSQREVGPDQWLDEVWAEGGAILDLDHRRLVLFGGEDLMCDVPLRRIWLRLLTQTWPGWEIRWAHEGIADLVDYVGRPRSSVLCEDSAEPVSGPLDPPDEPDWVSTVIGVVSGAGDLRFFPIGLDGDEVLRNGPSLLEDARRVGGLPRLSVAEQGASFPLSGAHIDERDRTIDLWTASPSAEVDARVAAHWPDYRVRWHRDRFEDQLERSEGRLSFPERPLASLIESLSSMLLAEEKPGHPLDGILEHFEQRGEEVQVNAWALRDDRLPLPTPTRSARFRDAVAHAFPELASAESGPS